LLRFLVSRRTRRTHKPPPSGSAVLCLLSFVLPPFAADNGNGPALCCSSLLASLAPLSSAFSLQYTVFRTRIRIVCLIYALQRHFRSTHFRPLEKRPLFRRLPLGLVNILTLIKRRKFDLIRLRGHKELIDFRGPTSYAFRNRKMTNGRP